MVLLTFVKTSKSRVDVQSVSYSKRQLNKPVRSIYQPIAFALSRNKFSKARLTVGTLSEERKTTLDPSGSSRKTAALYMLLYVRRRMILRVSRLPTKKQFSVICNLLGEEQ